MKSHVFLVSVLAIATSVGSVALVGAGGPPTDIPGRAHGAAKVVVAQATNVTPRWRTNAFGDQLIVSLVELQVEETLKGDPGNTVWLEVEGGTLNGVTLRVSSMTEIKAGDRAVFFLDETKEGLHAPHMKGKGILKLNANNIVSDDNLSLQDIRRLVRDAK